MVYSYSMKIELQRLKEALQAHHQALQQLQSALRDFEETLKGQETSQASRTELLSIEEVCQALGMGKSFAYKRIKNGEIPSIRLGRSIKVKRQDLEEYLESQRHLSTTPTAGED